MLIVDVSAVNLPGRAKQNNLPHKCGQPIESGEYNIVKVPMEIMMLLSNQNVIHIHGARAFQVAAPRLWNALPLSVRGTGSLDAFKAAAKTHLFKQCFIA
jgi:hypothetical protein